MKQDLSFALRIFRKSPAFTVLVILTLALGIGANTAVFSILQAVLLQPLPYPDADRLVANWDREIHAKGTSKLFDLYTDYENWKKNSRSFENVAALTWASSASPGRILTGHGPARTIVALPVTADFFSLLGVRPILGRTFNQEDIGRGCAVVMAESFWKSSFEGATNVVGQTIRLDDQTCAIRGVMPSNFAFLPPEAAVAMWTLMPRPAKPEQMAMAVFARLRPGISIASAQSETLLLHRQIHQHDRWGAEMEPVVYDLHGEFTWLTGRNLRLSLIVLFGAVTFVLLICCVNVANLLLGRALQRNREMAIRAALGSGKARLMRQLLTESLALSFVASLAGIGIAAVAIHFFDVVRPIGMPPGTVLQLNATVLAFTALLSIMTTVLFGLVPAWKAVQTDLNDALKAAGRNPSPDGRQKLFARALIVAEVMLTVILLSGASLLIQSLVRFGAAPLGFDTTNLLTAAVRLPKTGFTEPDRRSQFFDRLQTEINNVAGIEGVAFSTVRPLAGGGSQDVLEIEGHPEPAPTSLHDTFQQTISAPYFRVMNTPLIRGRFFDTREQSSSDPDVIINEAAVRKYFQNEDPIGKHVRPFNPEKPGAPWWRIVGVVGNEKRSTVYNEMSWVETPIVYRALSQNVPASVTVIARLRGENAAIAGRIQSVAKTLNPDVPVEDFQTVRELESSTLGFPRFRAVVLGAFSALALILAMVGLFGVLSHLVTLRTHEIGVRMALGAQRGEVLKMFLRDGLRMTATGVCLGIGVAWIAGPKMESLLYGTRADDPTILATVAFLLFATAAIAVFLPARRASKVDPSQSLNYE